MKKLIPWLAAMLLPLAAIAQPTPVGGSVTQIIAGANVTISPTNGRGIVTINSSGGGGSGTVTTVGFTGGLISVANPTTTPALTVAGTSGGIPYFSGAATWASSAALAANAIVIGGGAGAAPSTITTGANVLAALGIAIGSAGAVQLNNGSGAGLTSLTAANISVGALANGMTATTQSAAENSTKIATTAYADAAASVLTSTTDPTAIADDTAVGAKETGFVNSGGVTQWDAVYQNTSSQYVKADANGSGTYPATAIAIGTVSTGGATTVITSGYFRDDGQTWTVGSPVYLSTTAGGITSTPPSTTGDKVQVLGTAVSAHVIRLKISPDYVTSP